VFVHLKSMDWSQRNVTKSKARWIGGQVIIDPGRKWTREEYLVWGETQNKQAIISWSFTTWIHFIFNNNLIIVTIQNSLVGFVKLISHHSIPWNSFGHECQTSVHTQLASDYNCSYLVLFSGGNLLFKWNHHNY